MDETLFLYQAIGSENGICVETTDPEKLRQRLYAARAKLKKGGDNSFDGLSFHPSPKSPKNELWIVKDGKETGKTSEGAEGSTL